MMNILTCILFLEQRAACTLYVHVLFSIVTLCPVIRALYKRDYSALVSCHCLRILFDQILGIYIIICLDNPEEKNNYDTSNSFN